MTEATYDDIFGAALALRPGLRAMLAEQLIAKEFRFSSTD
jgi:hypothetical protein